METVYGHPSFSQTISRLKHLSTLKGPSQGAAKGDFRLSTLISMWEACSKSDCSALFPTVPWWSTFLGLNYSKFLLVFSKRIASGVARGGPTGSMSSLGSLISWLKSNSAGEALCGKGLLVLAARSIILMWSSQDPLACSNLAHSPLFKLLCKHSTMPFALG